MSGVQDMAFNLSLRMLGMVMDAVHLQADYPKHKSWYLEVPVSDERLWESGFTPFAASAFEAMQPFRIF